MADRTFKGALAENKLVTGTPGLNEEQINGTEVVGATSSTDKDSGWDFNTLKAWIKLDADWMSKSIYDANVDGRADNAERLFDGTNSVTASEARTHINNADIHFEINDGLTTVSVAWSGSKINTELGNKADQTALNTHIADDTNPHSVTHAQLPDKGTNAHSVIDSHLAIGGATPGNPHGVRHSHLSDVALNYTHAQIDQHIDERNNPHQVTHAQVSPGDAYSHSQIDGHINSDQNPHSVTAAQVGAAPSSHVGDSTHLSSDERDAMDNVSQPLDTNNPFATMADIPSGQGHVIQDDGADMTQRPNLNFTGPSVRVTDEPSAPTGSATKIEILAEGDVFGPGSSVVGNLVAWDNTTGTLVADANYKMPAQGNIGQVLGKVSGADYDWGWIDQTGGSGEVEEAPNDTYGYVRMGPATNAWARGSRVFEQATPPSTPSIGDAWIDTSP